MSAKPPSHADQQIDVEDVAKKSSQRLEEQEVWLKHRLASAYRSLKYANASLYERHTVGREREVNERQAARAEETLRKLEPQWFDLTGRHFGTLGKPYTMERDRAIRSQAPSEFAQKPAVSADDPIRKLMEYGKAQLARQEVPDEPMFQRAQLGAEQTSTSTFRRWFGASKVVDEHGRPLPLYHGSNQLIDSFNKNRLGSMTKAVSATAFYFTSSREEASLYAETAARRQVADIVNHEREVKELQASMNRAEKAGNWDQYERLMQRWEDLEISATRDDTSGAVVVPVYLALRNPLVVQIAGAPSTGQVQAHIDKARHSGNDGVILRQIEDAPQAGIRSDHYVAFEPEQIKSAIGNSGAFDPRSADILSLRNTGGKYEHAKLTSKMVRDRVNNILTGFKTRPRLVVVDSFIYLPRAAREALDATGTKAHSEIRAIHWNGCLYFIADRIGSLDELPESVLHEIVIHFGTRHLIDDNHRFEILDGVARDNPMELRRRGRAEYGNDFDPANQAHRRRAAEEVLAYFAGEYLSNKSLPARLRRWVDKWLAAIHDGLRRVFGRHKKFDAPFMRRFVQDMQANLKSNASLSGYEDFSPHAVRAVSQTLSAAFRRWFGASKVVDEHGEPRRMYHGTTTPDELIHFIPGGSDRSRRNGDNYGVASYFTSSPSEASAFARDEGMVLPVYVRGKILDIDCGTLSADESGRLTKLANDVLLPSDKARFAVGRRRCVFTDKDVAREFFEAKRKDWEVFGDGMDRAWPEVVDATGGRFTVEFADYEAPVMISSGDDAMTLFKAIGWDNLSAAGFDGLMMRREGGATWVVMHNPDGNVKSAIGNGGAFDPINPDILAERQAPPYFSALTRAAEKAKLTMGSAQQWIGTLQNSPGVKPEEIKWSGLEEWISARKQPVTKNEVVDYLAANELQIDEVIKQEASTSKAAQERDRIVVEMTALGFTPTIEGWEVSNVIGRDGSYYRLDRDAGRFVEYDQDDKKTGEEIPEQAQRLVDDLNRVLKGLGEVLSSGDLRYQRYTLPGGENYRELLLSLPKRFHHWDPTGYSVAGKSENWFIVRPDGSRVTDQSYATREYAETYAQTGEFTDRLMGANQTRGRDLNYWSSHWSAPNVIAHVRFNERTDINNKRVLFIEEIQSDWHQDGRKQGYKSPPRCTSGWHAEPPAIHGPHRGRWVVFDADGNRVAAVPAASTQEAIAAASTNRYGVPDAPFKTTWTELAFKRVIRWAADHGFDRVAWTTGQQQTDRYNLSAIVNSIDWDRDNEGLNTRSVSIKTGRGSILLCVDNESSQVIIANGLLHDTTGKLLSEVLGVEVAERIMADERGTLPGHGLKVGGWGMRGFYDQILPSTVNKVVRQWGAKVGTTEIWTNVIGEGYVVEHRPNGWGVFETTSSRLIEYSGGHRTSAEAVSIMDKLVITCVKLIVQSIDVTPAMRDTALNGLPMFQRAINSLGPGDDGHGFQDVDRNLAHVVTEDEGDAYNGP